jgi:phage-related minor tail protein
MLKRNVRTICASLVATGAIFFAGNAYSNGNGAVIGQPQPDASANAILNTTVAATSAPQMNASTSATKEAPAANGQAVEREIFQSEAVTNK